MESVSVFLCGAGSRGRTVFGQFILDNPGVAKVVGVAEPQPNRRRMVQEAHSLSDEQTFKDWRDVEFNQRLADVVIVATDDQDHLEPALAFLEAGYHLLLEKPMAPNLEDCRTIVAAAEKSQTISAVCHVLRYTPYFQALKRLIQEGAVGNVVTMRHLEPVNYWHFAHSFVRGNWRNSEGSSPFILAKCCHDMDILYYLMGKPPVAVQSFGSLSYFREASAPPDTTSRCCECPIQDSCCYSATRFYSDMLRQKMHHWPLDVVIQDFQEDTLREAMAEGPYGRCVFRCDNNVPDHQVVNLLFEGGTTASLTATAFTERPARETEVMGSTGSLYGDGHRIRWTNFLTREEEVVEIDADVGHHLGGDEGMLREFFQAVQTGDASKVSTSPTVSLVSHEMALLAEQARLEKKILRF